MILAIGLVVLGWLLCRHARALEQVAAPDVPTPYLELVIEVRDRVVHHRNGGRVYHQGDHNGRVMS